ncbi:MAG: HIT domain-containing protein [Spirochaetes bacterium]|nr:HIT domain-containing protein [Spirochaetota bacterium]NLJ04342.1 HIT domain-containing protein [Exilispira sp.]MBP8991390.1 HIT domain-containing protein [Spirochaetota bacterium]HNV43878.1 HIT domain-containing protein [Exilispira sp.]HOV46518.1 HIT domain-containing protein [Exilispira sp.]
MENNCIFCKIVDGEIQSAKIFEDEEFIAILDTMPNTYGMTLILPKKHYDSYIFEMPDQFYLKLMIFTKKVVKILEKGLNVNRVAMVMEGMGINHAHIKLYPLHGVEKEFKQILAKDTIFFEKYEGYICTKSGKKVSFDELNNIANKIRESNEL